MREELLRVGPCAIYRLAPDNAFFFVAPMSIDADGAPTAYHPDGHGLDHLANAGHPGNWWALVTDTGSRDGRPLLQGEGDPAPGYYISKTTLQDERLPAADPRRYVDASRVPFVVLPPDLMEQLGVALGDLAVVLHRPTGRFAYALFADQGPRGKIGEGSVALADALGLPSSPRAGGMQRREVAYLVFPGSGDGTPKTRAELEERADGLFQAWGGLLRLLDGLRDLPGG